MANGFVFVDTNVWVARIIEDHVFHERAQTKLTQLVEQEEVLCLSGQIIRELISVCTLGRNLSRPLTWDELRQQIDCPTWSDRAARRKRTFNPKVDCFWCSLSGDRQTDS
jgi:predicted nucleic acid-binding protein